MHFLNRERELLLLQNEFKKSGGCLTRLQVDPGLSTSPNKNLFVLLVHQNTLKNQQIFIF